MMSRAATTVGNLCRRNRILGAVAAAIACLAVAGAASVEAAGYLGPCEVAATKDGKSLLVLNLDAGQIAVVDTASRKVARTIPCPAKPTGFVLSPDGVKLYVTCATPAGSVAILDAATGQVSATIPVGHTPRGPAVTPDGKRLFVPNQFNNNVSVIDLEAKKELARVPVIREPIAAAVTPDGKLALIANQLPNDAADSYNVAAAVSVIDTASNQVAHLRLPNGSSSLRGITVSPDGKYAYVVHLLSRYQMPTTQLERGWMNTNAMTVIDVAQKKLVNTVLLDDVDFGASNPWGVACTADGSKICITTAGTHELCVINAPAMLDKLLKMPATEEEARKQGKKPDTTGAYSSFLAADVPNDLAFLVDLKRRIKLDGNGPRGLAVVGNQAFAALYFSDALAVVDLVDNKPGKLVSMLPLGPAPHLTAQRRGEMNFHDAALCFQQWQSCASCHPDARVDALNWDLMNDGMGTPKNNKSMLLVFKTAPAMWLGVRPTPESAVRSGITHIQFAVRPESDAEAIDAYLKSLTPVPSPYLVGGQLSDAAQRGKALFFSARIGCHECHPEPLYTDLRMHDVGSKGEYDGHHTSFDTPSLIECWRTAPYMHDGHYVTIKELLTKGKHGNRVGEVEKLTEQEVNDLVEFVLSL
jgi:YVTN family beta-propeller protein